jgi:hypothetical protein
LCSRASSARRRRSRSSPCGTSSSAAADGVGARRSAAKSARLKSVSWPIADTTGTFDAAIARARASSLNAHRSSSEPPPRASSRASKRPLASARRNIAVICAAAVAPCTGTGRISTSSNGNRRASTLSTSRTAAPLGEVITPSRRR